MKTVILSAFLLLSAIAIYSCSKSSTTTMPSPTNKELLMAKTWSHPKFEQDINGITTEVKLETCEYDNLLNFNTNGQMIYDEGKKKCKINNPQFKIYTCQISKDMKTIYYQGPDLTEGFDTLTIEKLTYNTLKLRHADNTQPYKYGTSTLLSEF